uniref:Protein RED1 n=2 Tax=Anthurium amnicola TaxID=1678845 RepID=A0A1D1XN49_9ARAE
MVLHAHVILDLHEVLEQEISFEQVEGDFDSFRGKWLLEQLGNDHTLLKYSVESKLHKDTFLSEALVEEVIYEDLPSNLCAIRDFIEKRVIVNQKLPPPIFMKYPNRPTLPAGTIACVENKSSAEIVCNSSNEDQPKPRLKVHGLQRDIDVLKAEILTFISKHGQEGFMPMRKQLRLHGRVDIEKAITRMGGFRKIANLMNLSLAYKHRKPKGYWDNLENLRDEISRFQRNWGMDPTYMPSRKSFERAGRYDIARALEKWGGLQEVSRLLSLELRRHCRQSNSTAEKKFDTGAPEEADIPEKGNEPSVSQDTHKWLMKLKDLDINWVE